MHAALYTCCPWKAGYIPEVHYRLHIEQLRVQRMIEQLRQLAVPPVNSELRTLPLAPDRVAPVVRLDTLSVTDVC